MDATQLKWTYFLLGCAALLPWSALTNETSFFLSRLADSPFSQAFPSYLNSTYMVTKLACQFYCTYTSKQSSPARRIYGAMIAAILLVGSLFLSTFIRSAPSTFFSLALLNAAFLAASASYLCTAAFSGAALLGASVLQALYSGQAAVGVAASAVQVISSILALWNSPGKDASQATRADGQAEEIAARIFLGVSAVFLCVTLAAYAGMTEQPFYTNTVEQNEGAEFPDEHTRLLANERHDPLIQSNLHVHHVFRKNLIFMGSLVNTFAVTLASAIFPAISSRVQPVSPGIHPLLFTAVHFLVYYTGDLLGRYPHLLPCLVVWSGKKILVMSLLRTLFVPLILLCNFGRPATIATLSIIRSDVFFMVVILTMGYTNGYVSTSALLSVSSLEHNPRLEGRREDVDVAATLGGSFITLGLVAGTVSSFGVEAMI